MSVHPTGEVYTYLRRLLETGTDQGKWIAFRESDLRDVMQRDPEGARQFGRAALVVIEARKRKKEEEEGETKDD